MNALIQNKGVQPGGEGMWRAILVIIGLVWLINVYSPPSFNSYKDKASANQTKKIIPKITNSEWKKDGFGNVLIADFFIINTSSYAWKDLTVKCSGVASSGTVIDKNERVIYEIIKPGESKYVKAFNMGFLHSQVEKISCSITDAVEI